jgi:hypothetical protein
MPRRIARKDKAPAPTCVCTHWLSLQLVFDHIPCTHIGTPWRVLLLAHGISLPQALRSCSPCYARSMHAHLGFLDNLHYHDILYVVLVCAHVEAMRLCEHFENKLGDVCRLFLSFVTDVNARKYTQWYQVHYERDCFNAMIFIVFALPEPHETVEEQHARMPCWTHRYTQTHKNHTQTTAHTTHTTNTIAQVTNKVYWALPRRQAPVQ